MNRRFTKTCLGVIEIRVGDCILARPTSLDGAAVWFRTKGKGQKFAKVFVNGSPMTRDQRNLVHPERRRFLPRV